MQVKDLIELLSSEDPHKEVFIASDPEGNDFNLFEQLGNGTYDLFFEEMVDDEDEGEHVIILWP